MSEELARVHHGRFRYALKDEQVKEMRERWKSTRHLEDGHPDKPTYRTFMDEYGIGNNTVWKVLSNQSYKWVK